MKKLSDYIFSPGWENSKGTLRSNEQYVVLKDVGQLKQGEQVKFIGYDDVDNHYGIFVFVDANDNILEVNGDFCGLAHFKELEASLARLPAS